jgi:hypothetical protein
MDQQAKPSRYEIHVGGLLSERLLGAFPELDARGMGRVTVLVGDLPDQAALHGVLSRIESLGIELLEVRRCGDGLDASPDGDGPVRVAAQDHAGSARSGDDGSSARVGA